MNQFWLEYLYFIASFFAILVSVSAGVLFILTYRMERKLLTVWRWVGFFSLAIAFFLYILERKYSVFGLSALVMELVGFFAIYKGVLAEPKLSQLSVAPEEVKKDLAAKEAATHQAEIGSTAYTNPKRERTLTIVQVCVIIAVAILIFVLANSFIASAVLLGATIFVVATIPIQIRRYRIQSKDPATRLLNLYPLIAFIFFVFRGITLILYRLPDLNIVVLRQAKLEYSLPWELGIVFTLLGFLFLFLWAWNFIRVRIFLRIYVVLLTIAIIVSSLGALVFTTLIFRIVEQNNLGLMAQGAQTQSLIMAERSNNALFIARLLSDDQDLIKGFGNLTQDKVLSDRVKTFFENSGVDTLRIYNKYGEVLTSPSDTRDIGRKFNEDKFIAYAITEKKQLKTFDLEPGVLAPTVITRSIVPLTDGDNILGAAEIDYKFDNAFADFSKEKTNLDVTVYSGDKRSATTIKTLDGVSRWTGSNEADSLVTEKVLNQGESYSTSLDRLGIIYYNAFEPVRNINGEIIGMVAVGVPTNVLFEDSRQQLVSTFLIITLISLLGAAFGYFAINIFQRKY